MLKRFSVNKQKNIKILIFRLCSWILRQNFFLNVHFEGTIFEIYFLREQLFKKSFAIYFLREQFQKYTLWGSSFLNAFFVGAIFWVYVLVERLSFWNVFFEIAIFSKKNFGMYFLGKHFLRCIFREQFFKNNIWNVFFEGENSLKEILKCFFKEAIFWGSKFGKNFDKCFS